MKVGRFGLGFKSVFHVTGEIKVMHFNLKKNNMAALNNKRVVQIDFIFLSVVLT